MIITTSTQYPDAMADVDDGIDATSAPVPDDAITPDLEESPA